MKKYVRKCWSYKENIEKYNKVANEWEKDLKQRLDEITKKYKELTGRDIKEDLEIE